MQLLNAFQVILNLSKVHLKEDQEKDTDKPLKYEKFSVELQTKDEKNTLVISKLKDDIKIKKENISKIFAVKNSPDIEKIKSSGTELHINSKDGYKIEGSDDPKILIEDGAIEKSFSGDSSEGYFVFVEYKKAAGDSKKNSKDSKDSKDDSKDSKNSTPSSIYFVSSKSFLFDKEKKKVSSFATSDKLKLKKSMLSEDETPFYKKKPFIVTASVVAGGSALLGVAAFVIMKVKAGSD